MEKRRSHAKHKRARKSSARRWHLPHLMVAAGILVALVASIPVGAYLKASVLVAQEAGTQPPPPPPGDMPPPPPPGDQPPPPPPGDTTQPAPTGSYMCNGVMIPNGTPCMPTGTVMPPPPVNMPVCAPGQVPTSTAPCMMQTATQPMPGTGTIWCQQLGRNVNTALECPGMTQNATTMRQCAPGEMPTATNPCVMTSTTQMKQCNWSSEFLKMSTDTCMPRTLCTTKGSSEYDSTECKGVRGETMNTMTNTTMRQCAPGETPTAMNPCVQTLTPDDTRTIWCPNLNRMATQKECSATALVKPTSDCWDSTNTTRFASQECTVERARVNDQKMMQPNMNPCPAFPTPAGSTSFAPCAPAPMPWVQPMFDTKQYEQGPFNFDYNKFNEDFKVDFNQMPQVDQSWSKREKERQAKDIARSGKQALSEIDRMVKEVERVIRRSGNLSSCPPIAKAQAGIATAKSLAELMVAATPENVSQAAQAQQQLGFGGPMGGFGGPQGNFGPQMGPGNFGGGFGGPQGNFGPQMGPGNFGGGFGGPQGNFGPQNFGPQSSNAGLVAQAQTDATFVDPQDTIWFKLMNSVGQSHMCEGVTFFSKEVKRFVDEIDRMYKRTKNAEVLAQLTELKSRVVALENPFSRINFDDLMPGEDPMQDLMMDMGDLRMEFGEIMESLHGSREQEGVCGALEGIREGLTMMEGRVPDELFGKAANYVTAGLKACQSGNVDLAREYMSRLERLKNQFMAHVPEEFEGEEDEDEGLFSELDTDNLLNDIPKELADKIAKMINNQVALAVDAATRPLLEKIAAFESKFAADSTVLQKQTASTEFVGALSAKVQASVATERAEVLDVMAPLDNVVAGVAAQLPVTLQEQYKTLLTDATTKVFSTDGSEEVKKAIDAVNTALESADTAKKRVEILKAELPTALATVQSVYKADADDAFKSGRRPFKDLEGNEWFAKYGAEAREKGIFTQETINADRPTNVAEGVTILARAVAGGDANVGTQVDLNNPVVQRMPEWARPAATFLINEKGVDLGSIIGNKRVDQPMTRVEMFRTTAEAFDLQASNADAANKFSDVGGLSGAARNAAAALVDLGIVSGQGDTGRLDPNGVLNRAAFAKITLEAVQAAGE